MLIPLTAFISPGGSELIFILLILILLFGAKDAPRILRSIQTALDKMQRTAADFRYKLMYGDLHQNHTPASTEPYDGVEDYIDHDDDYDEGMELKPEELPEESEETPAENAEPTETDKKPES